MPITYDKLPAPIKGWILKSTLNSNKMRLMEKAYPVTGEQQRWLTFGAVLFTQSSESCRTLKMTYTKDIVKNSLASSWDIDSRMEALKTIWRLSIAKIHAPFTDDVYKTLIRQGNLSLETPMSLPHLSWLDDAYQRTAEVLLDSIMDMYKTEKTRLNKSEIKSPVDESFSDRYLQEIIKRLDGILMSCGYKTTDDFAGCSVDRDIDEGLDIPMKAEDVLLELGFDEDYIMAEMVANIDYGLENYRNARKLLIELGYTEKELAGVRTTTAWDYGRTAVIARRSVHLGYINENEAWEFMKAAAENAVQVYSGWRDYLAGYVLGRAIGYGNDSRDMVVELKYLLNSRYSPLKEIVF